MSPRPKPELPSRPHAVLIVEGGDEGTVCEAVAGAATWADIRCRNALGRTNLVKEARLIALDGNLAFARSIGVLLDVEDDPIEALDIAARTLAVFGAAGAPVHATLSAGPRSLGVFFAPDGASHGCIETLCRAAVRDQALAACVDALVTCAGRPHAALKNPRAKEDKAWTKAYLSMLPDPDLRFHQAFSLGWDPAHAAFDPLRRFLRSL
jgi:hypothetical protein